MRVGIWYLAIVYICMTHEQDIDLSLDLTLEKFTDVRNLFPEMLNVYIYPWIYICTRYRGSILYVDEIISITWFNILIMNCVVNGL